MVEEEIGDQVLSLEMTRKNAKRARDHMICYYTLEKNGESTAPSDVQRMMKKRKTHSCVVDTDKGWICSKVRVMMRAQQR